MQWPFGGQGEEILKPFVVLVPLHLVVEHRSHGRETC